MQDYLVTGRIVSYLAVTSIDRVTGLLTVTDPVTLQYLHPATLAYCNQFS